MQIVARTRDWLRYEVPEHFIRKDARGHYRGQKQIWFLLRLVGHDSDLNLRATDHPEFDAWRWNEYWVPLDLVIEFKRNVYEMALTELARFLPRVNHHNRYLRAVACAGNGTNSNSRTRRRTPAPVIRCRRCTHRAAALSSRRRPKPWRASSAEGRQPRARAAPLR